MDKRDLRLNEEANDEEFGMSRPDDEEFGVKKTSFRVPSILLYIILV
jgi:hypothetical protein